jgi:predicted kinase
MKELFLLRGLPGSGKTTLAKSIDGIIIEADQYFMENGEYKFDGSKIKLAHRYCQSQTEAWMKVDSPQVNVSKIIVSNTFTQEWEMEHYYKLAETYGYRVYSIIVENRHGGVNVHGVPDDKVQQMRDRFEIKL